jgi:acetyl esterase/lipase
MLKRLIGTLIVSCSFLLSPFAISGDNPVMLLWPGDMPGEISDTEGYKPTLTAYLPSENIATGSAVVICPGGGYGSLSVTYEGDDVAKWFNSQGLAAFVLQYRQRDAGYGHPAPVQDVQRAMRTVRARAGEWGVKPDRIGIIGFSAGGHLASCAGTLFTNNFYEPKDDIDSASCRPDFMILMYPVITMSAPHTHEGSRKKLLGDGPSQELLDLMSTEKQVTKETPPTFLVHTGEDEAVPAENSVLFYSALRNAGVSAQLHIYDKGPHGVALGHGYGDVKSWPDRCLSWMRGLGVLPDN